MQRGNKFHKETHNAPMVGFNGIIIWIGLQAPTYVPGYIARWCAACFLTGYSVRRFTDSRA
ncbi:hypothetical protein BDZ91DRAFT_750203 [Kalaharituber pfeilii]|nr:hypothetical protein BDZ91DRAFT_750203 [Kalaharituber pfeilii]